MSMHRRRSEFAKRWTKLAAVPAGALAAGAMVLGATHASVTASNWNPGNTIETGKWTRSKVTSDRGTSALVNVKGLMPGREDWAEMKYDFAPGDKDGGEASWGQIVLKGITAKDSLGNQVTVPSDSELAKHLQLEFVVDKPGDTEVEVMKTLGDWYDDSKSDGGRSVIDRFKLDREDRDSKENGRVLQIAWYLDPTVPDTAQLSSISFDVGAEIDVES
ncbi:hypothetical protein ABT095_25600 [Kitasatospora sp. NPDC002227]|uniref:hypothetical protein n=1 Tax=Kitasatospora sp. NPDC002227 TaxID=3154773 RepID=UPI003328890E